MAFLLVACVKIPNMTINLFACPITLRAAGGGVLLAELLAARNTLINLPSRERSYMNNTILLVLELLLLLQ